MRYQHFLLFCFYANRKQTVDSKGGSYVTVQFKQKAPLMSNIHNNSVLQSASNKSGIRTSEAQNESNGLGSAGYFVVNGEENNLSEESYVDRSDLLMSALGGLATLNSSRLFVNKKVMKKLASKNTGYALRSIA